MAAKANNKPIFFRVLILMLACFVCAGMFVHRSLDTQAAPIESNTIPAKSDTIPAEYKLVTEGEGYELYLYEPTMSIIIRNQSTGACLYSTLQPWDDDGENNNTWMAYMNSGVVLSAIKGNNDTYQVDLVSSPNEITYTYSDSGFSAKIYFKEYKFGLTVNVSLEEGELVVEVPDASIIEETSGTYIGTISLFPLLGYTYLDAQEGYMFIPDGNGALIYLDDKDGRYASGFSQMIYGNDIGFSDTSVKSLMWDQYDTVVDAQKVFAPVFGMIHSENALGYLAVVEEGEKRASIEAHPNGVMVDYNRCFAKFLVRRMYIQPLNNSNSGTTPLVEANRMHSDLKVRYILVSEDAADYSGMAVAYREYLLERGLLSAKDSSYHTRVDVLGSEREEFLVFTRAVPMTTTDQLKEMYEELQRAGVESLLTVYKGWQKGGLYHLPITGYKADSSIGGTGNLTELIQGAAEKNYHIYLYDDALLTNPKETNTTFNAVKKITKRRVELDVYGYVYRDFNYLLPSKAQSLLNKFVESHLKKGVENLALTGITNNLYSYTNSGKIYSRFDCADSYESIIKGISEKADVILETPFLYLWNHTNAFLDMPIRSSDYMYEDEEIPFFSICLKGIMPMYSDYVNFEANKKEFRLQMIETGVFPSFYLTYEDSSNLIYTNSRGLYSTKYEIYKDEVVAYDKEFRALAQTLEGAMISRHETLENGVKKVVYDSGVTIYVNYSETAKTADGYTVDGLSYKVGESK